ncbi:MAG: Na(+)/H(+) antiporter subunit D [Chloroflexi bacterium]|nr:Na(+)/H(+) antiporter subunit D [Chloroflexota bacterium]
MVNLPPAFIFIAGAIVLLLLPRRARATWFLVVPVLAFVLLLRTGTGSIPLVPFLEYELVYRVDRLSLAFGYIFIIMTFLGGVYGLHLKDAGQQAASLVYAGSALGVVFAGDLVTLFIFWEIMAMSSVWLILARRTAQSARAGMRYMLVHLFGGSLLLAGILWHVTVTGSTAFNFMEGGAAAYLILAGFAINAAIPPLHAWLPDAYPEATVTGSVFLSAFTTKTAVYVLARSFAGWEILIWAGVIMALYGVIFAVLENDIRRLLAYHIVSQVGYMVAAVGIGGETAINGATAHAFAHILYKGLLFMGAGAVLYATGKSKLTELGGLARAMPLIFGLYMIGAFSISGVPLFSGFVSKSMVIYAAELKHLEVAAMLLYVASVGTFLHTGLKLPYFTWLGPGRSLKPTPIPPGMYAGMALTAALSVAIGVYPALLYNLLPFPVSYAPYTVPHVVSALQLLAFTGLGFWLLIKKLGGEATVTLDTDWFYRRPSRLAYQLCVVSLSRSFGAVEAGSARLVQELVVFGANPQGYLLNAAGSLKRGLLGGGEAADEPAHFDPNRYRSPLAILILIVLLSSVIIIAWNFLAST